MPTNHFPSNIPQGLWWPQQPMTEPTQNTTPSSKHQRLLPQPTTLWPSYHLQQHLWSASFDSQEPAATSMFHCGGGGAALGFSHNHEDDDDLDEQITEEREYLPRHQRQDDEAEEVQGEDREPMFEKPLTPSDVGKLNRLVIPKQHAEKYFPLGGDSGDKGLLLSFEDESGKSWRFRYSYWNSSQSYVLTKGWSRFVKEKRLDAGDIVLFERHRGDGERLFIGWRRRAAQVQDSGVPQPAGSPSAAAWTRVFYSAHPYPSHPLPYQPDCLHAGSVSQSQPSPVGSSKRLRLFGVNLECQLDESSEPTTSDGSSLSSQGPAHQHFYPQAYSSNRQSHNMDMNISGDVNQMRNRRG